MRLRTLICLALLYAVTLAVPANAAYDFPVPEGFTSGYRLIDGVRMHYVKGGHGPLVFLVHGFGESWYKWHVLMPKLATSRTVVAVDLPGLGNSGPSKTSYVNQDIAVYLYKLAKSFSPRRKFDLVAHDIGIWNTYPIAVRHQADIARIIYIEAPIPDSSLYAYPAYASTGESLVWHFSFFAAKGDLAEKLITGREQVFFDHFIAAHTGKAGTFPTSLMHMYAQEYAQPGVLHAAMAYYQDLNDTIRRDVPLASTKISVPLLAIGGGDSFGVHEAMQIREYATSVEGRVMTGCGHWLPEECEIPTDRLILKYLLAPNEIR